VRRAAAAQEGRDHGAVFVTLDAAEAIAGGAAPPAGPATLVYGWRPDADDGWIARAEAKYGTPVRCCRHGGGPPRCWCRPPLPGLLVEFAEKNGVDLARSTLVGTKTSDATLARAIGADFRRIDVGPLTRDTS